MVTKLNYIQTIQCLFMYIEYLPVTVSHFISNILPTAPSYVPVFQQALFLLFFQKFYFIVQLYADFHLMVSIIHNLMLQLI